MPVNISKEMFDASVDRLGHLLMMSDVQTVVGYARELERDVRRLNDALNSLASIATEAHALWDANQDHKCGKLLLAMGGHVKKYRQDTDWIHEVIAEFSHVPPTVASAP